MTKIFWICLLALVFLGCSREKWFDGPNSLVEDFESVAEVEDLFPDDDSRWVFFQATRDANSILLDSINPHTGQQSIRFFSQAGDVSKSALAKNQMAFYEGEIVSISAWYYLADTGRIDYLFLMDIEEDAAIGAGPGIRIAIGEEDALVVERNKYGQKTLYQRDELQVPFPRREWVKVTLEVDLQTDKTGRISLYQNDTLILDATDILTLPRDRLYFTTGTKGMYQSVQFGITAVSLDRDLELWMDDIEVRILN